MMTAPRPRHATTATVSTLATAAPMPSAMSTTTSLYATAQRDIPGTLMWGACPWVAPQTRSAR